MSRGEDLVEQLISAAGARAGRLVSSARGADDHLGLQGTCLVALAPSAVEGVAAVVALCRAENLSVVPQGGRTGLVGGALPTSDITVVIAMDELNRVRRIDPTNFTVLVEAGAILADLQRELAVQGLRLPLDLGSSASCQIGGLISTNAGGIAALRFGSMRDLVLGLEVILPSGEVWDGLRHVRKDNTGYDLKQCFVGAEGTLGLITAAVLKIVPIPKSRATAWIGLDNAINLMPLFSAARCDLGEWMSAFELISAIGFEHALGVDADLRAPLKRRFGDYVMIELESSADLDLEAALQAWLENQVDLGRIADVAIAQNLTQRAAFWRIRELTPWGGGQSIQFDVSVPISSIPRFLDEAQQAVRRLAPDARINAFGHVGDGNIHYHICPRQDIADSAFSVLRPAFSDAVHDLVAKLGGSFSAEHGIGLVRKRELHRYKTPLDLALMAGLKVAFDPTGIMNPGKILG